MDSEFKVRPCVGCGFCCKTTPCHWALITSTKKYKRAEPCEFLVQNEIGQFRCGLYLKSDKAVQQEMARTMGFGAGCSSPLFNNDRKEMILKLSRSSCS